MDYQPKNTSGMASSDSSDTIAMIMEIIFGLFGILGTGWLYAGNVPYAIAAFVGYIILLVIELAIGLATAGLAACVFIPINIIICIVSGLRVRDYVRNTGVQGSVMHVLVGLVGGILVICMLGAVFTLFFGGLGALLSY